MAILGAPEQGICGEDLVIVIERGEDI